MSEIDAVTQLVLHERQGRDRGWWQQMRDCFDPHAMIRLSWYRGGADDFITQSQAMATRGDQARHRLCPPVVQLAGLRAVVEVSAAIAVRAQIEGVQAALTSYTRILYRAQKARAWQIMSLDCVYESDSIQPVIPGAVLNLDADKLGTFREPYRMLAYHLASRGYTVADDLYGDDQPEQVGELYAAAFAWLRS